MVNSNDKQDFENLCLCIIERGSSKEELKELIDYMEA